jgi:PIN domain nuclease of toxin-antitoxin system
VRLLLATHTFLWFVLKDPSLSAPARALMIDPQKDLLLSPANDWEMAIKIGLGKSRLAEAFDTFVGRKIEENELEVVPITIAHAAVVPALPFHHNEPSDRLLIALAY